MTAQWTNGFLTPIILFLIGLLFRGVWTHNEDEMFYAVLFLVVLSTAWLISLARWEEK